MLLKFSLDNFISLDITRVNLTLVSQPLLMRFLEEGISKRGLFLQLTRSLSYAILSWILVGNNVVKGIQMVNIYATSLLQFLKKWVSWFFLVHTSGFSLKFLDSLCFVMNYDWLLCTILQWCSQVYMHVDKSTHACTCWLVHNHKFYANGWQHRYFCE